MKQAISRNPTNWKASKELAELYRRDFQKTGEALRYDEQAERPTHQMTQPRKRGYSEKWGLLLRDGGQVDSASQAIERLGVAYGLNENDPITVNALAHLYEKRGAYRKVIDLCKPWKDIAVGKARENILPMLERAYRSQGCLIEANEIRAKLKQS